MTDDAKDEFGRLQAESKRMSDKEIQLYHNGSKPLDDGIRERLSRGVKRLLVGTNDNGFSNADGILILLYIMKKRDAPRIPLLFI